MHSTSTVSPIRIQRTMGLGGPYDGPNCPDLLGGDKALILIPDYYLGLLQPLDLSSLPDGRSTA